MYVVLDNVTVVGRRGIRMAVLSPAFGFYMVIALDNTRLSAFESDCIIVLEIYTLLTIIVSNGHQTSYCECQSDQFSKAYCFLLGNAWFMCCRSHGIF